MHIIRQQLILNQLERKIKNFYILKDVIIPPEGWINAIRTALKMSLRQLGNRMKITPQSVKEIEQREKDGTVTLNTLKQAANALNMRFIYGFIPINKSLDQMIEERAYELAKTIVLRTSNNMRLEDQENSRKRITASIKEHTIEIKKQMPRYLWD